ncbi:flagellar basal-body rod protein FlgB [Rhodovulum imhoffii]|uniref:Flagellar basal-body rod protein FlgB n=1 Tax=Rhodovulum imhoffii TaxID=365340 RepID=A0A2T5BRQ8_9RHOB|nr:FlgB family protein [Rhodovulum imhoffii]MBK5934087.1 flagellar basal body rod protein FlgB [Rhodovulum imhoffii]PTN01972.1 flagellar basal-body rod protein FlgB [Rhodovulum imhoffii]
MFDNLQVLRMAGGLAWHAAGRQDVIARNIANADTPGYRAQDVTPFAEMYRNGPPMALRTTRPGHFTPTAREQIGQGAVTGVPSPNGNSVSLEDQMVSAVETRQQHDLALTVYKSSLGILRSSLGRR